MACFRSLDMVDIENVWLPQILWYANFLCDEDRVRAVWTAKDLGQTSVTSFAELISQVFDDLDSDRISGEPLDRSPLTEETKRLVRDFINELGALDALDRERHGPTPSEMLEQAKWKDLKRSAADLAAHAASLRLPTVPKPTVPDR